MANERDLRHRIDVLESMRKRARRVIASKTATIKQFRAMLITVLKDNDMKSIGDSDDSDKEDDDDEDKSMENDTDSEELKVEDDDDDDAASMDLALWDEVDSVYRCKKCAHEIEEGYCGHCRVSYTCDSKDTDVKASIPAVSDAASEDRRLFVRGATPLRDIDFPFSIPPAYSGRYPEFLNLLHRGATPEMSEAFCLEYSESSGIIAWADQDIFDTFSGPGMVEGDKWKIFLGRRIELDPDDKDGSQFLEGLLEDILMYPVTEWPVQWETYRRSAGIWVTKPRALSVDDDSDNEIDSEHDMEYLYEDDGRSIPANTQAHPNRIVMYDAALEFPFRSNNEPVIAVENYKEDDGSTMQEDELEDEEDPSWAITAQMPDSVYDEYDDDEEQETQDDTSIGAENQEAEGAEEQQYDTSDSEPGSDWDSDEELSGDEVLGWKPEKR